MKHPFGTNILVTGATSGIGLACARLFASQGYQVWGVARNVQGHEETGIRYRAMDVTDSAQVEEMLARIDAEAVSETGHHLSVVLDAAGNGITGSVDATPIDMVRRQMEVNFFGTLTVNRAALPFLRQEPRSLILLVSSVAGRITVPFQGHYSCSKYAVEAYGEALRMESARFGVHVSMIEPGDTTTGFTKHRVIAEPEDSPYRTAVLATTERIAHDEQNGDKAERVAKVALSIASHRRVPVRRAVGFVSKLEVSLIRFLPASLVDWIVGHIYLGGAS